MQPKQPGKLPAGTADHYGKRLLVFEWIDMT
jgi:hypothetical protein